MLQTFRVFAQYNHQTHHRGQISALLSQRDLDYGYADLVLIK